MRARLDAPDNVGRCLYQLSEGVHESLSVRMQFEVVFDRPDAGLHL